MVVLLFRLIVFPWHTHWVHDPNSIVYNKYHGFIFLVVTHPPGPGSGIPFSAIQSLGWSIFPCQGFLTMEELPIVCMIPINSLQELSRSPLPCGHSPSRPRLRHPLLCYIVPQVIHLSLPRFSRTWRIPETLSSLTIEASLRISLLRCPYDLCYHNTTYSMEIMAYHRVLMSQK